MAESLASSFKSIIREENDKPETLIPVGVQYQLDLGIYSKSDILFAAALATILASNSIVLSM